MPYLDLTDPDAADPQREEKRQIDARIAASQPADLWRRWQEIRVEYPGSEDEPVDDAELRQGLLGHEAGAIEQKLIHTPARNVADVLIKMRLAEGLIQMLALDEGRRDEEELDPEDRLMLAAYADLKRLVDG